MYRFLDLPTEQYLFVARARAAPGRDRRADDDAQGRSIAHVWFQPELDDNGVNRVGPDGDSVIVKPIEGLLGQLILKAASLSEILGAAGVYPIVGATDTARDIERQLELKFLDYDLVRYKSVRVGTEIDPWSFCLMDVANAEEVF